VTDVVAAVVDTAEAVDAKSMLY